MNELRSYRAKRDFESTPEPPPKRPRRSRAKAPRFVIQQHSARRLHWDLRLEHDGVAASWALPRGLPDDPKRNHLAVHTEDHPIEYLEFEGEIPKGEYGAGTMTIWDRGTYELEKWRDDEVIVVFHGERAEGRYALIQTGKGKDEKNWLIHRMDPPVDPAAEPMPSGIKPMLARPGQLPREEAGWAYEIKWDGVRAIAYSQPGEICFESRNLREITRSYPELRPLARALGSRTAVLDGEIVAFDEAGRPSFSRLQERMHVESESAARRRAQTTPVTYMIFDLLYLDGHSQMDLPYERRRELLEELALSGPAWQTPALHHGDGEALLAATAQQGLEGLVAKRLDAPYEPGRRTGAWLKVKNTRRQELVIGGWTPGEGRRTKRLGALLTGYYEPDGHLVYAGGVGTGFSERTLDDLGQRLEALARSDSPFAPSPQLPRNARFVEPRLVAEVEFTEWTPDGQLRHPSFQGLREDRDPREVVREDPIALEDPAAPSGQEDQDVKPAKRKPASGPETVFDEVQPVGRGYEVVLEGRTLKLSNYDKVLYPDSGFTKGHLIEYYARIAPVILPHLRDRPLTLKRYPNGVDEQFFYEKNCPGHRPDWVQTVAVAGGRGAKTISYCVVQDATTLVWAANLASIELHTSLARAPELGRPTMMVFDLDPGPPAELVHCCEVGLILDGLFEGLGLRSLAKTSGGKGLQVYVPLNGEVSFAETKSFSKQVAELLEGQAPDLVVSRQTKTLRSGRVLVDWSQNDEHKTTVNVYSVRARERPTVSAPVTWQEVRAAYDAGSADTLRLTTDQVLERVAARGDGFADALTLVQALPRL